MADDFGRSELAKYSCPNCQSVQLYEFNVANEGGEHARCTKCHSWLVRNHEGEPWRVEEPDSQE
jgi:predicted SprT family Zn-dependent metalloprotease